MLICARKQEEKNDTMTPCLKLVLAWGVQKSWVKLKTLLFRTILSRFKRFGDLWYHQNIPAFNSHESECPNINYHYWNYYKYHLLCAIINYDFWIFLIPLWSRQSHSACDSSFAVSRASKTTAPSQFSKTQAPNPSKNPALCRPNPTRLKRDAGIALKGDTCLHWVCLKTWGLEKLAGQVGILNRSNHFGVIWVSCSCSHCSQIQGWTR